jgi:hypothetical protein
MRGSTVSLCVVVDGPSRLLRRSLASVATQTWPDLDPLVVCPDDRAGEVAAARRHLAFDRLRVVIVDTAGAAGAAGAAAESAAGPTPAAPAATASVAAMLAAGVAASQGDHIAWLTSADVCDPRRIALQMAARGLNGSAVVTACLSRVSGACRLDGQAPSGDPDALPFAIFEGTLDPRTLLVPHAVLEAAGPIDAAFGPLSEHELALRLAAVNRSGPCGRRCCGATRRHRRRHALPTPAPTTRGFGRRRRAHRGFRPHPNFATHWYSVRHLGIDSPVPEALCHFVETGARDGAEPAP